MCLMKLLWGSYNFRGLYLALVLYSYEYAADGPKKC